MTLEPCSLPGGSQEDLSESLHNDIRYIRVTEILPLHLCKIDALSEATSQPRQDLAGFFSAFRALHVE